MNTDQIVNKLYELAQNRSKTYNDGNICYPYALGFTKSALKDMMSGLNLSKKQIQKLEEQLQLLR